MLARSRHCAQLLAPRLARNAAPRMVALSRSMPNLGHLCYLTRMSSSVTRIIRFVGDDVAVHYGEEPLVGCESVTLLSGDPLDGGVARTADTRKVRKLLTPVKPTDIFCIGLNYMRHYEESAKKRGIPLPDKPVVFMKPSSSLTHPGENIWIPQIEHGEELDWEVELAVVIGKPCRDVKMEGALEYVLGYTVGIDISSRHWQKNAGAGQWIKGKSFDSFCPLGPVLVTTEAIPDPQKLRVQTRVNGQTQQDSNTADMIHTCAQIIEWLSDNMTLLPGTVILTGTPEGVGAGRVPPTWLKEGDVLETEIPEIGVLCNTVVKPSVSVVAEVCARLRPETGADSAYIMRNRDC